MKSREYQTAGFKWRFLTISIRAYVRDEEDAQEELATLFEDIEKIIDENDALVYDTSIVPNGKTTSITIDSLTTDEGVIAPLGIGGNVGNRTILRNGEADKYLAKPFQCDRR